MNYIELYGFPLSGKTTLLKKIKSKDISVSFCRTDKSFNRKITTFIFCITNTKMISLFCKSPLKYGYNLPTYFRFASRYKEYLNNHINKELLLVDEGIVQAIFGFVSSLHFNDSDQITKYLFQLFLKKNNDSTILIMDEINFKEFKKRSIDRIYHHPYITCRLTNDRSTLERYKYIYNLVLSHCKFNSINLSEFLKETNSDS